MGWHSCKHHTFIAGFSIISNLSGTLGGGTVYRRGRSSLPAAAYHSTATARPGQKMVKPSRRMSATLGRHKVVSKKGSRHDRHVVTVRMRRWCRVGNVILHVCQPFFQLQRCRHQCARHLGGVCVGRSVGRSSGERVEQKDQIENSMIRNQPPSFKTRQSRSSDAGGEKQKTRRYQPER